MAKTYSDLWKRASELEKEGERVAGFESDVAKLPYELKEEFRKRQDPVLTKAINKAQQKALGGAIEGLDMYQDISNPFTRRNLAEMYQGGLSEDWQNLVGEKERREGVYSDYITKWTGLYGAEAAKERDLFQNQLSAWDREKNLADTEESIRQWNVEQSQRGSSDNNRLEFLGDAIAQLEASKGQDGKFNPELYKEIRNLAYKNFKSQFASELGTHEWENVGIKTTSGKSTGYEETTVDKRGKATTKIRKYLYGE